MGGPFGVRASDLVKDLTSAWLRGLFKCQVGGGICVPLLTVVLPAHLFAGGA